MDLMEGENDTMFVFAESDKVIQSKESPISINTYQTNQIPHLESKTTWDDFLKMQLSSSTKYITIDTVPGGETNCQ